MLSNPPEYIKRYTLGWIFNNVEHSHEYIKRYILVMDFQQC